MFERVVPSRDRRSQIASSGFRRLLFVWATRQVAPFGGSMTSVSAPQRDWDTRENSILSSGPSSCQGEGCLSNSCLSSQSREPQPRIAMYGGTVCDGLFITLSVIGE